MTHDHYRRPAAGQHPPHRADAYKSTVSHPAFEPHPIQGRTPDFIPLVLQEALDNKYHDQLIPVAGAEGFKWAKALAQKEGSATSRRRS